MKLTIFDVEHGACALLTCDNGAKILIDAGHNSKTGWKPGDYLSGVGTSSLEMLVITNYDEDHVSGIGSLFDNVYVEWLWRNKSVSAPAIRTLKTEDGMGAGIERLVDKIESSFSGGSNSSELPTFKGLERKAFHNSYPAFDDENNLSFVTYLRCNGVGVMFTGDMEKKGWAELLKRDDVIQALKGTSIFIAPHHGRESGCYEGIFKYCEPYYVVISDKGYMYDTQLTLPFYRKYAKGGPFRGKDRRVLTTRKDGTIHFQFDEGKWWPY